MVHFILNSQQGANCRTFSMRASSGDETKVSFRISKVPNRPVLWLFEELLAYDWTMLDSASKNKWRWQKQIEVTKKEFSNKKRNVLSSKSHTKYSFSIKIASSGKTIYELLFWIEAIKYICLGQLIWIMPSVCNQEILSWRTRYWYFLSRS